MYILGIITGILVSLLIVLTLTYFRAGVEKRLKVIETMISKAGPAPKGFVFEPPDEADEVREEYLKKNKGRDIPLKELM